MANLIQLWIAVLALALCVSFRRRLSSVATLQWWAISWSALIASVVLGVVADAAGLSGGGVGQAVSILRAVCEGVQITFVALGVLKLQRERWPAVLAAWVAGCGAMLFFWVRFLGAVGSQRAFVAADNVTEPIACGILAICLWPGSRKAVDALVSTTILLAVLAIGFLNALVLSGLVSASVDSVLNTVASWPRWNGAYTAAVAVAMAAIALRQIQTAYSALRSSWERLHGLVDSTPFAICHIDPDGSITLANQTAGKLLGRDRQELTGTAIQDLLPAESGTTDPNTAEHVLRPAAAVEQARGIVRRPDGAAMEIEWAVAPVAAENMPPGGVVVFRDVTRSAAEERFLHSSSKALEMVARNKSLEQTAGVLAEAAEERIPGSYCSILFCDGDWFRILASRLPDEARSSLSQVPTYRVAFSSQDSMANFSSWKHRFLHLGTKHGFVCTWVEPMTSSANEILGAVVLNDSTRTALTQEERQTLERIGRLAALAVEHRRSTERLTHQGHHDALTGLPNRLLLEDRLKQGLARAERSHKNLAVLAIDLDRFKYVNDTFGHDTGDLFLQQLTVRLSARIRSSDTLARTGGDEFTAIICDIDDIRAAEAVAQSLTSSLAEPFEIDGHTLYGAVSIGVAIYPKDGRDAETLRRNADRALYRAKAKGRNMIQCYSYDDAGQDSDRLDIEVQLHRAIQQGNFELQYQPQFTCDRQLVGFEALLRFRHPKLGMVPPSHFIPIAEESGLILPIGDWVLQQACRQIKEWEQKGLRPVRIAVNGSPLQFSQADFRETVEKILHSHKVRPDLLELEVTEGMLMQNVRDSASQMRTLSALGVKLSVDDFGTGYSSLSYLHQLPIHVLKIDRSFVAAMLEASGTRPIVEAIISLAHGLGLKTIAEGVENEHQLAILKGSGCDYIQGYIFSRPLTAIDASRLLWESQSGERITPLHAPSPDVWIAPRALTIS